MNRRDFTGHLTTAGALMLAGAAGSAMSGCTALSWLTTLENDLPTITGIATTIASIVADATGVVSPAAAALITAAVGAVNVAATVLVQLIKDYQANPSAGIIAKINTSLLDIQSQLGQILTAAHVENLALRAAITTGVGLAIGVVTAILSLLPSTTVAGASKAAANATSVASSAWVKKPTDPATIKLQFKAFLTENGYGKYAA